MPRLEINSLLLPDILTVRLGIPAQNDMGTNTDTLWRPSNGPMEFEMIGKRAHIYIRKVKCNEIGRMRRLH